MLLETQCNTGRAWDTLGDTINREQLSPGQGHGVRESGPGLGPRLARAGCSHELAIMLIHSFSFIYSVSDHLCSGSCPELQ